MSDGWLASAGLNELSGEGPIPGHIFERIFHVPNHLVRRFCARFSAKE